MAQPENSVLQPSITYCHHFGNAEGSSSKNVKKSTSPCPCGHSNAPHFSFTGDKKHQHQLNLTQLCLVNFYQRTKLYVTEQFTNRNATYFHFHHNIFSPFFHHCPVSHQFLPKIAHSTPKNRPIFAPRLSTRKCSASATLNVINSALWQSYRKHRIYNPPNRVCIVYAHRGYSKYFSAVPQCFFGGEGWGGNRESRAI